MTTKKEKTTQQRKSLFPEYTSFIKDLAKIAKDSQLNEIEFKENDVHIKITKNKENLTNMQPNVVHTYAPSSQPAPLNVPENNTNTPVVQAPAVEDYSKHAGAVLSPMVGIVYTAPNPDSSDFVKIGDTVKKGDTLLLIEAMKVFNTIKATKDGKVLKILVKANQAVEYNQPLIVIE